MASSYFSGSDSSSLPSWNDSFNFQYKPSSSGSSGSSSSSNKRAKALELATEALASSFNRYNKEDSNSYRDQGAQFGSGFNSNVGKGPDDRSVIYTYPQHAPMFVPGVQGEPSKLGEIGGNIISAIGSIAASDIRVKENIEKVGVSGSGTNVYRWNYIGHPQRYQGVIAQEVPWACIDKDGIKYVDYSKVDVDFQEVSS